MQTTRRGLDALVNRNSRIVLSTNNRSSSPIDMMPAKLVGQTGGSGNSILNTPPPTPRPRVGCLPHAAFADRGGDGIGAEGVQGCRDISPQVRDA